MKLSILKRTTDFRGDHAADVLIAYDVVPGETVEQLAARVFGSTDDMDLARRHETAADVVEVRVVFEPPEPSRIVKPSEPDIPF